MSGYVDEYRRDGQASNETDADTERDQQLEDTEARTQVRRDRLFDYADHDWTVAAVPPTA